MGVAKDYFDQFAEEDQDVFDEIDQEETSIGNIKTELIKTLEQFDSKDRKNENRKLTDEIKSFIQAEVSKIRPKQNVIEKTIQKVIEPRYLEPKVIESPPQIIKEVRVEVQVEKKDTTKYVEESKYLDLLVKLAKMEGQIKEAKRLAEFPIVVGGPGVIGIPPPEPNPVGYVLTVNSERKAQWKVATASGGGSSSDAYTPSNVVTDRSYDATNTSMDELANVLGSLIASLQGAGIIQ